MNITLHIEKLVLGGLPLTKSQGPLIRAAVEAELMRLIAAHGLTQELCTGGAFPFVPTKGLRFTNGADVAHLGARIAQAVYGGIGGAPSDLRPTSVAPHQSNHKGK